MGEVRLSPIPKFQRERTLTLSLQPHSTENGETNNSKLSVDDQIKVIKDSVGGGFLQLRMDILRYLQGNTSAAVVLSYLSNQLRMMATHDSVYLRKCDLWIRCPAQKIQKDLCIGKDKQIRAIGNLVQAKLLMKQNRQNNYLWVKINADMLKKIHDGNGSVKAEVGKPEFSEVGFPDFQLTGVLELREPEALLVKESTEKESIHCRHDATASGDDAKPIKSNGKPTKVKTRGDSQTRGQARSSSGSTKDGERSRVVGDVNPESKVEENGKRHARGQARSHSNRINGFPVENGKPVRASVDVTEFGTRTAILLRDGLMAKNKIMRHPSIEKWSISLREMRTLLMDSRKLTRQEAERSIEELINDHVKHIRDDYQPEAYSADTFCKKYESIERARDRRSRKRKPVKTIKNDNGSVKRIYPDDPEYDQYLPDEDTHSVKIIAIDAATGRVMSRDEFTDDEDY